MKGALNSRELLVGGQKIDPNIQNYDPRYNNCQKYLSDLLKGSSLMTPELNTFINQDVQALFKKQPFWVEKIARKVTDIAGAFDTILHGRGTLPSDSYTYKHP
jgi:hypothetical protein